MDKLTEKDIDIRLNRLLELIDCILTNVTASIEEKEGASFDKGVVYSLVADNLQGKLRRSDLSQANRLWEYYTGQLE